MEPVQKDAVDRRPLVIERPDLQTLPQRWGYRGVTVLCWLLWLYLFVPLLSFLAWVAGLSFAYRLLLQGLNVNELWEMLSVYALGIGMLTSVYLAWAFYSYLRFRGVERRLATPLIDLEAMAASHSLSAETVGDWRQQKHQTIDAQTLAEMFDPRRGAEFANDEPAADV